MSLIRRVCHRKSNIVFLSICIAAKMRLYVAHLSRGKNFRGHDRVLARIPRFRDFSLRHEPVGLKWPKITTLPSSCRAVKNNEKWAAATDLCFENKQKSMARNQILQPSKLCRYSLLLVSSLWFHMLSPPVSCDLRNCVRCLGRHTLPPSVSDAAVKAAFTPTSQNDSSWRSALKVVHRVFFFFFFKQTSSNKVLNLSSEWSDYSRSAPLQSVQRPRNPCRLFYWKLLAEMRFPSRRTEKGPLQIRESLDPLMKRFCNTRQRGVQSCSARWSPEGPVWPHSGPRYGKHTSTLFKDSSRLSERRATHACTTLTH